MAYFELNVGLTGLFASQRGLQVTANNIANAGTKGYSKQVLTQKADTPLSGCGKGMIGTGVYTTGILRVRNGFLDTKLWNQSAKYGEYAVKTTQNALIEGIFGEPSDAGFTEAFNNLFNSIDDLSKDPTSTIYKTAVKEQIVSFNNYFNNASELLTAYQKDLNYELKTTVQEINNLGARIQSLNEQIMQAELHGSEASSFRDERDNCIDALSKLINVEVEEETRQVLNNTIKTINVKVGNQVLVSHNQMNTLEISVRKDKVNEEDTDGLYEISWSNGLPFDMYREDLSGELKGIIDMRDGRGAEGESTYRGIPYYINRLDTYISTFATSMNEAYSKDEEGDMIVADNVHDITHVRVNKDGTYTYLQEKNGVKTEVAKPNDYEYEPKYKLFTYKGAEQDPQFDKSKLTAASVILSPDIAESVESLRSCFNTENGFDPKLMESIMALKDDKSMFNEGNPKEYMISIFSELGISSQSAQMTLSTQEAVVHNIEKQRSSVSQVDISEEFTYLIQYQQAYQSAAKVMTTIDDVYNTTIFKLGNF